MRFKIPEARLSQQQAKWLKKAADLLCSGRYREAHEQAQRVLAQVPENDLAAYILARCNEQAGELARAIEYCRKAIGQAPQNRDYRLKLAALLLAAGDLDEAEQRYKSLCEEDDADIDALLGLARANHQRGDAATVFSSLLRVKHLNALPEHMQPWLVETLSNVPTQVACLDCEQDLCDFLDYKNINPDQLISAVSGHLCSKHHLMDENPALELEALLEDRLLNKALKTVVLMTPQLEELLTGVRSMLLTEIASIQSIPLQVVPFIEALALQNHLNEYVHYVSENEREILALFSQVLATQAEQGDWTPAKSEVALLCLAMYGRLYDLAVRDRLLSHSAEDWPISLQAIARATLFEIDQEIKAAAAIPSLTPIDDAVSLAVQAQYESNPYPRWIRPGVHRVETYGKHMASVLPNYKPPACLQQKAIEVLIAGCGTGQQPVEFAIRFDQARITAVDISRRSLAYAQHKAQEFGVSGIDFYHGDILKLGRLDQHFDLILCSGVLHHMSDPLQGWQVLRDLLAPQGILRIDLYSQIARREIIQQREIIAKSGMEPTPDNIRRYRKMLMQSAPDASVLAFRDFWSMSNCRDLLFHCQEHQFSWPQIQQCCDRLDMEFVGLHAPMYVYQAYRATFPADPQCRNLDNWHRFELDNPHLFRGMYAFWCKRK